MTEENKTVQEEMTSSDSHEQVAEQPDLALGEAEANVSEGTPNESGSDEQKTEMTPEERLKSFESDYTKKTQALAEERKSFETKMKEAEEKLRIYDAINSNPKAVEAVKRAFGKIEEPKPTEPEMSEDEIIDQYGSRAVYERLMKAEQKLNEYDKKISSIDQHVSVQKYQGEIESYGNTKGNEDFFDLRDRGIIKPFYLELQDKNPNATVTQLISASHKKARDFVNNIRESALKAQQTKQQQIIEKKKSASMDRGVGSPGTTSTNPKDFEDIVKQEAQKLGIAW